MRDVRRLRWPSIRQIISDSVKQIRSALQITELLTLDYIRPITLDKFNRIRLETYERMVAQR
jgi:hypothetical protein